MVTFPFFFFPHTTTLCLLGTCLPQTNKHPLCAFLCGSFCFFPWFGPPHRFFFVSSSPFLLSKKPFIFFPFQFPPPPPTSPLFSLVPRDASGLFFLFFFLSPPRLTPPSWGTNTGVPPVIFTSPNPGGGGPAPHPRPS